MACDKSNFTCPKIKDKSTMVTLLNSSKRLFLKLLLLSNSSCLL